MTSIFRPAFVVRLALFGFLISNSGPVRAQSSDAALDSLLAPIALYPDALLAQVLTAATSPDQVTEFSKWLKSQQATGSDLQQAAMDAKADELHLKTGPAFFLEMRENVAAHTDTKTQGPLTAAQWLARLDAWRAKHPEAAKGE